MYMREGQREKGMGDGEGEGGGKLEKREKGREGGREVMLQSFSGCTYLLPSITAP